MNRSFKHIATIIVLVFVALFLLCTISPLTALYKCDSMIKFNSVSVENDVFTAATSPLSSSTTMQFDTFVENYLYNLTRYHVNNEGSCSYIAIQMLLSYFNYYWNDNLIDDTYEIIATQNYDNTSAAMPGTTESFFNLLTHIGGILGYDISLTDSSEFANIITSYLTTYAPEESDRWQISDALHSNPTDIYLGTSITYSTHYAKEIKYMLMAQIPVIVLSQGYMDGKLQKHACIAYGIDETTDKMILNTGWSIYGDASTFTNEDDCILGYVSMSNSNSSHVHNDAFKLDNRYVCSCKLTDHSHKYTYKSTDSSYHTCTCFCGETHSDSHNFTIVTLKYIICSECGYRKLDDGGLIPILPVDVIQNNSLTQNSSNNTPTMYIMENKSLAEENLL